MREECPGCLWFNEQRECDAFNDIGDVFENEEGECTAKTVDEAHAYRIIHASRPKMRAHEILDLLNRRRIFSPGEGEVCPQKPS